MIRLAAQFFSYDRQFLLHYSFCDTVFQSEMRQQASCELNEGAKVLADKVFLFLTPCLLAPSLSLASELLKGILFFFKIINPNFPGLLTLRKIFDIIANDFHSLNVK